MRNPFSKRNNNIGVFIAGEKDDGCIKCPGYTSLDSCPEVLTAARRIAELIGSMTIHLIANTAKGDERIINELSRQIDVTPMPNMVRSTWMQSIVLTMLLKGRGNAVVLPHTENGFLRSLEPIAADRVQFIPKGRMDYDVLIDGKTYSPDDVLHFVYNPDPYYLWKGRGVQVSLKDVAHNLKQENATRRGFLESKWKPSIIVRVDAMSEAFSDPKKRKKILEDYLTTENAGEPWIIPGEQIAIDQVKPLTLSDLAISDQLEIDKRMVAAVFGEPAFLLGIGDYNSKAWNAFVQNEIRTICLSVAQEMTRKLILSPQWYLRFNFLSLMDWNLKTISEVYLAASDRGFVDGNEFRDKLGLSPREELGELKVLENYLPYNMSGMQKKLIHKDDEELDEEALENLKESLEEA